ncbi:MAG: aldo/keto reductase [Thermoleophilaceae bacterium]
MPREAVAETHLTVGGVEIPKLGLGTWQLTGAECAEGVRDALELGYRHIDTARVYENEAEVGRGMADAGVPRDDFFLTTKLAQDRLRADEVREQIEGSLDALATDHVDLLLIHWHNPEVPLEETLGAMTALRDEGMTRHIGVSNFGTDLLRQALELAPVIADQVKYHPYKGQRALLELAAERDVMVTAYSPFARGDVLDDPVLAEIADSHGRTPAQVVLRWLLDQPRVSAIPKASSHDRRASNLDVFGFELTGEQRARITGLAR